MLSSPSARCRRPLWAALLVVLFWTWAATPSRAQFQDIGYTFEPTVYRAFEADNAAFQDGSLYGGALGLSFGRYLELSTEYLANTGLTATFNNVEGLAGLLDRDLDVRRYGGRLRVNLYNRRVIPYLTVGSGVLRLNPEDNAASSTIYAITGGGITFSVQNRYRFSLSGGLLQYRYDPTATFLSAGSRSQDETTLVRVPTLNASLSLFLGGRPLDAQTAVDEALRSQFGTGIFRSLRLFATPFAGRIEFNDALGFPQDQNMVGVNAGVELGPFVGLRGFYWRAKQGDTLLDEIGGGFQDVQMYGSELRLRLNAEIGRGFVPYATLGGGYLDVLSGYREDIPEGATAPEDRFFSTLGGGLEVPLTHSIKVSGGLRSIFMNNANAEEVGDPGTVYGSLMYTAGFEFRLGGGSDDPPERPGRRPLLGRNQQDTPAPPVRSMSSERMARIDSLERQLAVLRGEDPDAPASNITEKTMTVPIPENGEIYIRFGSPVGPSGRAMRSDTLRTPRQQPVDVEALARALAQTLQQEAQEDGQLSSSDIEQIVQQSLNRFRDDEAQRRRNAERDAQDQTRQTELDRMAAEIDRLRSQLQAQESSGTRPDSAAAASASPPFYRQTLGRPLTYVAPVVAGRAGSGPEQVLLGVRGDYRTTAASRLHLIPEVAVGVGGGATSLSLLMNGAYSVLRNRVPRWTGVPLRPYVGGGFGIVSDSGFNFDLGINLLLGTTYTFGNGRTLFGEVSTLGTFGINRFTVGYRIGI